MPTPVKPCEGRFEESLQNVLNKNQDRAQWARHKCEACGLEVGAQCVAGKWIPEQHWPTVKYPPRVAAKKPHTASSRSLQPTNIAEEEAALR